jgi:hypothetical protein
MIMAQNAHASIGVLIKAMWLRPIVTKKWLSLNYRCDFGIFIWQGEGNICDNSISRVARCHYFHSNNTLSFC